MVNWNIIEDQMISARSQSSPPTPMENNTLLLIAANELLKGIDYSTEALAEYSDSSFNKRLCSSVKLVGERVCEFYDKLGSNSPTRMRENIKNDLERSAKRIKDEIDATEAFDQNDASLLARKNKLEEILAAFDSCELQMRDLQSKVREATALHDFFKQRLQEAQRLNSRSSGSDGINGYIETIREMLDELDSKVVDVRKSVNERVAF